MWSLRHKDVLQRKHLDTDARVKVGGFPQTEPKSVLHALVWPNDKCTQLFKRFAVRNPVTQWRGKKASLSKIPFPKLPGPL